ncbi:copper-binding protein [Caulobacter endophyticus]|uniref:copper-binding protein n=1 Tax=Caulobacter endophyticus TaxID=2172652 RepID=UPI00240EE827|nr:copper-binding protein [Caulobacter endophyticus]MDG2531143.1 copper-binding protein [Caulobacter endophyticus]
MRKLILPALAVALLATTAHAQPPGGGRGPGGGPPPGGAGGPGQGPGPGGGKQTDLEKVMIVGVVQAVDPAADRVTIAYQANEALNWPAGAMPFATARPGMLGGVVVGQAVRFTLSNHRIAAFLPEGGAGAPPLPGGEGPGGGDDRPPPPPR